MEKDKQFKPTPQWMAEKYDEMNMKLFRNELGPCDFGIFTSGKGSNGSVLGWFKITGDGIFISRRDRHMYQDGWEKIYINEANFCRICKPKIELNGNYDGSEKGFLETLVHEMCHYENYMRGFAPKQPHGREFKMLAQLVSERSNGMFSVQRIASAEQMSELSLNDEIKERLAKRRWVTFMFLKNGDVRMTTTSNKDLRDMIVRQYSESYVDKVVLSNDKKLIFNLLDKGYNYNMRTWRWWNVKDKDWLDTIFDYDVEEYINPNEGNNTSRRGETTLDDGSRQEPQKKEGPTRIFSIKTNNGVFEYDGSAYFALKKALKERFPNMSDETITKIMNNPNNYRMVEGKRRLNRIIESVIDEFMENEFGNDANGDVKISQNMNLGIISPLEL